MQKRYLYKKEYMHTKANFFEKEYAISIQGADRDSFLNLPLEKLVHDQRGYHDHG